MIPVAHWLSCETPRVIAVHPDGISHIEFLCDDGRVYDSVRDGDTYAIKDFVPKVTGSSLRVNVLSGSNLRQLPDRVFYAPHPSPLTVEVEPGQSIYDAAIAIERAHGSDWGASGGTIILKPGQHKWAGKTDQQRDIKTPRGPLTITGHGAFIVGNQSRNK